MPTETEPWPSFARMIWDHLEASWAASDKQKAAKTTASQKGKPDAR